MKSLAIIFIAVVLCFGCARVSVQGSKEPIKVDIAMRLDIYQHVKSDIDAIENIVSGPKQDKPDVLDKQSLLGLFIKDVYAQEGLSPEVERAALRRKDRINELYSLEGSGVIGENRMGLVEARDPSRLTASTQKLIQEENNDRMIIYNSIAEKNKTSLDSVQRLYAKRLSGDAPAGAPIETLNEASGSYEWKIK